MSVPVFPLAKYVLVSTSRVPTSYMSVPVFPLANVCPRVPTS